LRIAAAEHFRAKASFLNIRLGPGEQSERTVAVELRADPAAEGWYAGDMHHHSNVLDGFTPPEWVLRSQLAAGLDLAMLSDHDAVVNNAPLALLARRRGIPFVAGTELSPSWAHFNAYPLDPGAEIGIDVGRSTVQAIFAEARRMGASVLQVNHPFINYGYFRSQREGQIPGGYSADFDLVEVNGGGDNEQTIRHAWQLWNAGQRAYLGAGSDVHDVWHEESGSARMFVQLDGPPDVAGFVEGLKQGRAYASQGPLLLSGPLPGSEISHAAGTALPLAWRLQAVNGLARVDLVERGTVIETRELAGAPEEVQSVAFAPVPRHDTWYGLVLQDATGRKAWTNPLWIRAR
ncbi:MAG: CehA/McbA family metallohydrolase, partial [Gammaproteobacteria bacterium]